MSDIITINEHIGRTVVGKSVEETDTTVTINNPVIIHTQPNAENGQLQVQSFPYIFMEFLTDKEKNNWTFSKSSIVLSDVDLDDRIIQQYNNINNPQPPVTQSDASGGADVVKLFDDE